MPFYDLDSIEEREPIPGYHVRFVHSAQMTVAYWDVEDGAAMPVHTHPHEQISSVVEGRFELDLDGERRAVDPGTPVVIPSGTPHGGRALTRCRLIDVFHPVREDYR